MKEFYPKDSSPNTTQLQSSAYNHTVGDLTFDIALSVPRDKGAVMAPKKDYPDGSGSVAPIFHIVFAPKNFGF